MQQSPVYLFRWMWISWLPITIIALLGVIQLPGLQWVGGLIGSVAMVCLFLFLDRRGSKKHQHEEDES
ncbi:hypothetical protein [Marinococcus luteus]|uniref:hypothetical protein n=1 Tax=Marinococcus luteus TaxID=1122204 RepID=UPI002ACC63CD|nr:hypothetical protein [Marinococcus luteus]MDZ5783108.1 hypothetical protein [Marinococcus luteus]